MKTVEFLGQDCVELSNGSLSLLVTQSAGPRVISLRFNGGENIFAELPDIVLDCPGVGDFHILGGHRLWHAPENPRRTYLPDDDPVEIKPLENGVWTRQKIESETGIQKELKIKLNPQKNTVKVKHILTNHGLWPVTCAPWAITQMKRGGVALLPQNKDLWNQNPTLPNRPLTLWPYTDINSPVINWSNDVIQIRAEMTDGMLKIGFPNPRGWLAYWRACTLFVKRAKFDFQADYFDFGSSTECYCDPRFLELETLGPITSLNPGDSASHTETWELYADVEEDINDIVQLIEE